MNREVLVLIKELGSSLQPHNTLHKVVDKGDDVYWTLNGRDRFPKEWCEEITDRIDYLWFDDRNYIHINPKALFGLITNSKGFSLNHFNAFGYNSITKYKTNYFLDIEYEEYEKYMKENNLKF